MERRKALALAAASAGIFSSGLLASAAVAGFHLFGFGSPGASAADGGQLDSPAMNLASAVATAAIGANPPAVYVKQIDFVDEYVVVTTPYRRPNTPRAPTNAPTTTTTRATTTAEPTTGATTATTAEPTSEDPTTAVPTTAKPTTSTTRPRSTTTRG